MPLTDLQRSILCVIAQNRSPDSYVAGGSVLNAHGGRYSRDIDVFSDSAERSAIVAELDANALEASGFGVEWALKAGGFSRAIISNADDQTKLEWASDSAFRYFPTQPDPEFGYTLHPVDAACNKIMAAVSRAETRDAVDLIRVRTKNTASRSACMGRRREIAWV